MLRPGGSLGTSGPLCVCAVRGRLACEIADLASSVRDLLSAVRSRRQGRRSRSATGPQNVLPSGDIPSSCCPDHPPNHASSRIAGAGQIVARGRTRHRPSAHTLLDKGKPSRPLGRRGPVERFAQLDPKTRAPGGIPWGSPPGAHSEINRLRRRSDSPDGCPTYAAHHRSASTRPANWTEAGHRSHRSCSSHWS